MQRASSQVHKLNDLQDQVPITGYEMDEIIDLTLIYAFEQNHVDLNRREPGITCGFNPLKNVR